VKVSVVIPTSNGRRFLPGCLEALRRAELPAGTELETVVVDNGSTDGTRELLSAFAPVRTIVFPNRLGFARANNAARRAVTGDVVCFLNNDTEVEPGWLKRPLELFALDAHVHAVGSKLLFMHRYVEVRISLEAGASAVISHRVFGGGLDDKLRFSSGVGLPFPMAGQPHHRVRDGSAVYVPIPIPELDPPAESVPALRVVSLEGSSGPVRVSVSARPPSTLTRFPGIVPLGDLPTLPAVRLVQNAGTFINARGEGGDVGSGELHTPSLYAQEEVVPALCGAALLVRRTALDAAGWFPDYYTVYYEDVDLCLRLRAAGGLLVFCPSSMVNHYHTGTNREWSPGFIENVTRSSLLFVSRFGSPRLVGETVARKLRDARTEISHVGLRNAHRLWGSAHGTRGLLKALPALGRVLGERASAQLHRTPTSELLALSRAPYLPHASQER